jgi:N-dimethylarginine dimethylaminohydrolase
VSNLETIEALTDICVQQADIIKDQAYILEQFGAQVREEEALAARNRLREMGGDLLDPSVCEENTGEKKGGKTCEHEKQSAG